MKTVFIHPERCIGCKQCEAACAVAHSQSGNLYLSLFEIPLPKPRIHAEPGLAFNTAFPNMCRHCQPAPCVSTCPTGAIARAQDIPDIVVIDNRKCIGCAMCAMVCPFDVISYHAASEAPDKDSVAIKCDHCIKRQREGLEPACVEVCKVNALEFGELNELVKAARTRLSEKVSVAVGEVASEIDQPPLSVQIWRGWGASVSRLNSNGQKGP